MLYDNHLLAWIIFLSLSDPSALTSWTTKLWCLQSSNLYCNCNMDDVLKHLVSTKYCSFERRFRAKNCLISLFRALELLNIVAERIKMNKSKDKENPLQDSLAHQFCLFWYEYFRKTISYRKYWLDFKYPILWRT